MRYCLQFLLMGLLCSVALGADSTFFTNDLFSTDSATNLTPIAPAAGFPAPQPVLDPPKMYNPDDIYWDDQFFLTGLSGDVYALVEYNGSLIAGGAFSFASATEVNHIARWDGSDWVALGAGMNGNVRALTIYIGKLIAVGEFTTAGGQPAAHVAQWDGFQWLPLGAGTDGPVYSSSTHDGSLVVSGYFGHAGSDSALSVARWDGSAWHSMNMRFSGKIYALVEYDASLYVGGSWSADSLDYDSSYYDSIYYDGVMRYDHGIWTRVSQQYECVNIRCMGTFGDKLVVGCQDAGSGRSLMQWDGVEWRVLVDRAPEKICALHEYQGRLIVAGSFTRLDGVPFYCLAAWDGHSWSSLGDSPNGIVYALGDYGGRLAVGGAFIGTDSTIARRVALWDGNRWSGPLGTRTGMGIDYGVNQVLDLNGDLIAIGHFNHAGDVPIKGIARWNGSSWSALGDGLTTSYRGPLCGTVHDGSLYVAALRDSNWSTQSLIMRWNGHSWDTVTNFLPHQVGSINFYKGDLVATYPWLNSDTAVSPAMRWRNGVWERFTPPGGGYVYDFLVLGEQVFVAGYFADDASRRTGQLWWFDGTNWALSYLGSTGRRAKSLDVYEDQVIAGGFFLGPQRGAVAAWNGNTWSNIGTTPRMDDVREMAIRAGEIYVGGRLIVVDTGLESHYDELVKTWSGGQWTQLGSGILPIGGQEILSMIPWRGDLIVSGDLTVAGGKYSSGIARWSKPGCCRGLRANVDGDLGDVVTISDLSALVDYLFLGGELSPCRVENNVDGSGGVDLSDLTTLIEFLFFGGSLTSCP